MWSLPLPGAWIEMANVYCTEGEANGRSLYRERGLKFTLKGDKNMSIKSLPLPGAWIEIDICMFLNINNSRSLYRERGLKCLLYLAFLGSCLVAPFTGSVD